MNRRRCSGLAHDASEIDLRVSTAQYRGLRFPALYMFIDVASGLLRIRGRVAGTEVSRPTEIRIVSRDSWQAL